MACLLREVHGSDLRVTLTLECWLGLRFSLGRSTDDAIKTADVVAGVEHAWPHERSLVSEAYAVGCLRNHMLNLHCANR